MGMANGKMMAFALLAENRYGYPGNHTDKLATKSRTRTAQRWTEVLTMGKQHLSRDDSLTPVGCAADKAGLIEWKEVPREEKPTLYKAVEGIPGAEDATLMRGTLRVLRIERG